MTPLEHVLQAVCVALVVVKLEALKRRKRWGWSLAIAAEVPWLALTVMWRAWGMGVLSLLYGVMAVRGFRAWGRAPV